MHFYAGAATPCKLIINNCAPNCRLQRPIFFIRRRRASKSMTLRANASYTCAYKIIKKEGAPAQKGRQITCCPKLPRSRQNHPEV